MTPTAPYSPERKARVDSVDLLRGLIMVIMMLDHTRDFVHFQATLFDPSDVSRTYPALFFTRWITHFCAPVFVFLAGTGAYFQELRGKPKTELSRFLITRGIWLIVLEFTVLRVIIFFNFDYPSFLGFLQVIWVIGWGMIVLAGLIYLPLRVVLAMSVAMIVLHNALDGIRSASWAGPGSPVPGFGAS
ncbi:MAG TPA: heparan-alpha-glucosaminide N-acetyltransferase domain-containing protein, partial [Gemmatimonadaceae bacterium]|nr:heparan-alpha-glucosaminide N-acetyltransferase domain-containing protein [Gemmatimonadaceae bacterium]